MQNTLEYSNVKFKETYVSKNKYDGDDKEHKEVSDKKGYEK